MFCRTVVVALLLSLVAFAQPPGGGPGINGVHIHLNSADPDAAIAFWRDIIGASTVTADGINGVGTSGATILFTKVTPAGPSDGSTIGHLAVRVASLDPCLANLAKKNYKTFKHEPEKDRILIEGPDGVTVEVVEETAMYTPLEFSHIHLYGPQTKEAMAWYTKNLSARPAGENMLQLPGATLSFTQSDAVAPTAGRAVDHLAFEVRDLDATVKKLVDGGAKVETAAHPEARMNGIVAILIDPWGLRLELIHRN